MKSIKKQSGSVLIISMVIVTILTLVVVSAVQTTLLQQKMSNNLRDKDLAFQSAETAIKSGENYLYTHTKTDLAGIFNGTNGLHTYNSASDNLHDEANWQNRSTKESHSLFQVKERSNYLIEELPLVVSSGDSLAMPRPITGSYYRVTSKSKGGTDASLVILQSIYKKL